MNKSEKNPVSTFRNPISLIRSELQKRSTVEPFEGWPAFVEAVKELEVVRFQAFLPYASGFEDNPIQKLVPVTDYPNSQAIKSKTEIRFPQRYSRESVIQLLSGWAYDQLEDPSTRPPAFNPKLWSVEYGLINLTKHAQFPTRIYEVPISRKWKLMIESFKVYDRFHQTNFGLIPIYSEDQGSQLINKQIVEKFLPRLALELGSNFDWDNASRKWWKRKPQLVSEFLAPNNFLTKYNLFERVGLEEVTNLEILNHNFETDETAFRDQFYYQYPNVQNSELFQVRVIDTKHPQINNFNIFRI